MSSTARRCSSTGCSTRCAAGCPNCASCSSTSPPRKPSHYVAAIRRESGGDDHRASSGHQPQRHLRRRHPPASLLPADRQAREAPAGAAPRRDLGRSALLPRHRQRAARGPDQGNRLRLRRHLHRPLRARNLCRGVRRRRRARPARGLRLAERPAILPAAAQRDPGDAAPRAISVPERIGEATAPSSRSAPVKPCAGASRPELRAGIS